MLSSRRNILALLLALPVIAGCGFTPSYGDNGSAEAMRGKIIVDAPSDRNGFEFVRHLESRLDHATNPTYAMSYKITLFEDSIAIARNQDITRYNIIGSAAFSLRDLTTGKTVYKGRVEDFTSYGATSDPLSTTTAGENARKRLMVILGDSIVSQLIATAPEWLE